MKQVTLSVLLAGALAACAWNAGGAPGVPRWNQGSATQPPSPTGDSPPGAAKKQMTAAQISDLQRLLQQVFLDAARAHDLLSLIQPGQLKMTDAERAALEQQVTTLRGQLHTLEKWRYDWFYNPGNPDFGQKTVETVGVVIQQLRAAEDAVSRKGMAPAAASLREPANDLENVRGKLQAELAALYPGQFTPPQPVAGAAAAVAPGSAPSTAPSAAPPAAHPAVAMAKSPSTATSAPAPASTATAAAPRPQEARTAASTPSSPPTASPSSSPVAMAASSSAAAAAPLAAPLDPNQVKDLLTKVFLATARVNDLLGLVQPDKWKMNNADRALLEEKLDSLQSQMKALERARYQLFYNPQDSVLARQAAAALGAAVPAIRVIATSVGQYGSAAEADQLNQPAGELAAAEEKLDSYSAYLQQKIQQQLAARPVGLPGHVELETERIAAPPPPAAPLKSVVIFKPPMTPAQVKAILYKIYISEFRIRDLLGQERPEQWKAPPAEQALVSQARQTLLSQLATLEMWRARLNQDPGNMYDAFQVFRSVDGVFHPLRVFSREVIRYQGASMGEPYRRRANDLEASLHALMPYVGAILQHASDNVSMIQTDLDTCQNQLTYAMHESLHAPTPLKNVVPVFEGRRARARRRAAKDKSARP